MGIKSQMSTQWRRNCSVVPHQGVLETTMSNWLAHSLFWNRDYSTGGRSLINPTETEKFRSDFCSYWEFFSLLYLHRKDEGIWL